MRGQEDSRKLYEKQAATVRDHAFAVQDEQAGCWSDLQQIASGAEGQWRTACETYVQDMRAASAGDDAVQRMSAAHRTLQREYGRVQGEYLRAREERYTRLGDAVAGLNARARLETLDFWIECLRLARQRVEADRAVPSREKPDKDAK